MRFNNAVILIALCVMLVGCSDGSLNYSQVAAQHHQSGAYHVASGNYNLAIKEFTKAIELEPKVSYYRDRALAYTVVGDYAPALIDYAYLTKAEPNETSNYEKMFLIYIRVENYNEAVSSCNEIIRITPYNFSSYEKRGDAYKLLGRTDEARTDYKMALSLLRDNSGLSNSRARAINPAESSSEQERIEQKISDLSRSSRTPIMLIGTINLFNATL